MTLNSFVSEGDRKHFQNLKNLYFLKFVVVHFRHMCLSLYIIKTRVMSAANLIVHFLHDTYVSTNIRKVISQSEMCRPIACRNTR
jgi:hypothetical protein